MDNRCFECAGELTTICLQCNARAVPDVPELVRYDISMFGNGVVEMWGGDYVRYDQAAEMIAELKRRNREIELEHTGVRNSYYDERRKVVALEAELAQIKAQVPVGADEIYVDVEGYEGLYEVSNTGNVRSKVRNKILAKCLAGSGYQKADLWKDGKVWQTTIHRLVAKAFVDGDGDEVNHKDGNKENNHASNLEWCTRSENTIHSYYELGHLIRGVVSIRPDGTTKEYRSVCEAVRDGFRSDGIYRCLNKPGNTHYGCKFVRPDYAPIDQTAEIERLKEVLRKAHARFENDRTGKTNDIQDEINKVLSGKESK